MHNVEERLMHVIQTDAKMTMTDKVDEAFSKATDCHICNKELGNDKVRDHCNLSGEFRGASHRTCNLCLNYKNIKMPVFFHNVKTMAATYLNLPPMNVNLNEFRLLLNTRRSL